MVQLGETTTHLYELRSAFQERVKSFTFEVDFGRAFEQFLIPFSTHTSGRVVF